MKKLANYKEMINKEIKHAIKWNSDVILRPITVNGKGSRSRYSVDHTDEYVTYLNELGYECVIGNDSPRGGKTGKFIKVKIVKC